jgi:hypothetical protein
VNLNSVDAAKNIDHDKGTVTVKEDGVYFLIAAGQAGVTKAGAKANVKLWMRVNGKDVDNSNTEQALTTGTTAVLVCQGLAELKAGDKVQLHQSATGPDVGMVASTPAGEPVIPSMIFSIFQVTASSYAQLSSTETQEAAFAADASKKFLSAGFGKVIILNSVDAAKDVTHAKGTVTVDKAGTYFVIGAGQVGGVKATAKGSVKLWARVNGENVANSNTEQSVTSGFTAVLVCQGIAELKARDKVALAQSATAAGLGMLATTPKGEPVIPSLIFSLFKVD